MIETNDILKFLEGTLSEKKKHKVQLWIDSSESNRKEYMFYKSILENSNKAKDIILVNEDDAWENFEKLIEDSPAIKTGKIKKLIYRAISVAAGFLLLIIAYNLFFNKEPLYKEIVVESRKDTLTLVDGSIVYLDSFSKLKYFTRIDKDFKTREVELEGKAIFNIKHDENLPFVVKIKGAGIQVLGTIFKASVSGENLEVENIEGVIKLFEWENASNSLILHKGEKALYNNGEIKKIEPPVKEEITQGQYHKVEDVIEYLFKHYEIRFNTAPYAEITMRDSVFVDLNQPIEGIVNDLEKTSIIKYRKTCKNCYEISVLKAK